MDKKQLAIILLLSLAVMALLGCVEELASGNEVPPAGSQASSSEEVVGPDYHDSEESAFDALSQELDEIPEMSSEDLEAMLGE